MEISGNTKLALMPLLPIMCIFENLKCPTTYVHPEGTSLISDTNQDINNF